MTTPLYREAKKLFPYLDLRNCGYHGLAFKASMPDSVMKILFEDRSESEQKQIRNILRAFVDRKRMEALGFSRISVLDAPLKTPFTFSNSGSLC